MLRLLVFVMVAACALGAQQPEPPRAPAQQAFTDADAVAVLRAFAEGLESHSLDRFLAVFDADAYPGFPTFAAEMDSYFARYEHFRVYYQLKQTSMDDSGRGVMTVQMQLEELTVDTEQPVRHNALMRFEAARSGNTWRIVGFSPREFLS